MIQILYLCIKPCLFSRYQSENMLLLKYFNFNTNLDNIDRYQNMIDELFIL